MTDAHPRTPEIRNAAWLLADLKADAAWLAERPTARDIGRVTAQSALDELDQGHRHCADGPEPSTIFVGNATNVAGVARALAQELGRGMVLSYKTAAEEFEAGRMARLTPKLKH